MSRGAGGVVAMSRGAGGSAMSRGAGVVEAMSPGGVACAMSAGPGVVGRRRRRELHAGGAARRIDHARLGHRRAVEALELVVGHVARDRDLTLVGDSQRPLSVTPLQPLAVGPLVVSGGVFGTCVETAMSCGEAPPPPIPAAPGSTCAPKQPATPNATISHTRLIAGAA